MRVNNLKELERELMKRINTSLDTEVADTVKNVMTDHIVEDVYNAYEPSRYDRRYNQSGNGINSTYDDTDNTGLLDPDNIISTIDGNGGLSVQNVTLGSHYYYEFKNGRVVWKESQNYNEPIAEVIETGSGYDVRDEVEPRPFMENTHDDLKSNHYHTQALKRSLKKQGLEVK